MSRADDPFSEADKAALAALTACYLQTNKAVQELARVFAARQGVVLDQL